MSAKCKVAECNWETDEPSRHISGCLATWHVYEEHPDAWKSLFGDRPPIDPDVRIPEQRLLAEVTEILNAP
jgi:hypothetical protein